MVSTRSFMIRFPAATCFTISNWIDFVVAMNPSMNFRMSVFPLQGSIGMLWYTASSVNRSRTDS